MKRARIIVLALLSLGCVEVEGFDPAGDVAAIRGTWTIDGQEATGARCEDLGADRVRVTFMDEGRPTTHSALVFQCRLQSFDTGESRGAGAVVGAGEWSARLDAIDGSGNVLAVGDTPTSPTVIVAPADGPDSGPRQVITIPETNFLSATISARFRIGTESADQRLCEAAGIETVELTFDDPSADRVRITGTEPCQVGLLGARVLPGTEHVAWVRAYAGGTLVSERGPFPTTPTPGQDIELDASFPIDF